ncbi:MAG: DUF4830 domain-containing protein, partial [Oscillospiraceae bacterium]|nr:DUF4830 domain-containing protein [Oscillospiraceae bacterium]
YIVIIPHVFKNEMKQSPESYLTSLGYNPKLISEEQITLPEKFNSVLQEYNNLQKEQGFDLSKYAGKSCIKKRFSIFSKNISEDKDAVVDLLLFEGKLVGGDLHFQIYNQCPMKIDSMS